VVRVRLSLLAGVLVGCLSLAGTAAADPIFLPTIPKEIQHDQSIGAINPPAPPCPQDQVGVSCTPVPETFALGIPYPGNMAYYGGHVQVTPKLYLVYWGWGQSGAWPSGTTCTSEPISEGSFSATLPCDPDGAGKYMADFLQQMGGTPWAGVQTQYFQTTSSGAQQNITNPSEQLAGIWVDDTNPNTLPSTNINNPAGQTNTLTVLGQEAQRAVTQFGITDLDNADIVIVQPPGLSDPNAASQGYCAFHDYTYPDVASGVYNGIQQGISYSNIPYQLNSGSSCGENSVNSGAAGKVDGFSIVLGHEVEETVTDPGAEDVTGSGPTHLGGWYDTVDANENGDKCAWVGVNPLTGQGPPVPIPGAVGDIKGNAGSTFAVQSLWSNAANAGTGYCAGAGTDSPLPSQASGSSSSSGSGGSSGSGSSSSSSSSSSGTPPSTSSSGSSSSGSLHFTPTWQATTTQAKAKAHKRRRHRRKHHRRRVRRRTHRR
jgi:serine protease